ncbi:MAG: endonuclease/exonuclease/phosphatase family protein [Lautropia sp.]
MPYYTGLKEIKDPEVRARTVDGLMRLREGLAKSIPIRTATNTLLLATWNIREFDNAKSGNRDSEAYFYIAEVLSRFDLIAIQELRAGLYPLQRLRRLLGSWWDFLVTDLTLVSAGSPERMAYLYDRRKVNFTGLAAELVLPRPRGADKDPQKVELQFARSPYLAGFRAGWAYLTLGTVHIYYGKSVAVDKRRLAEISAFAKTLAKNAPRFSGAPQYAIDAEPTDNNLIILGDFNIFNRKDVTMQAITQAGFVVPESLRKIPGSNVPKTKHYDQIAYFDKLKRMRPTGNAGVFDFFKYVYRVEDEASYAAEVKKAPNGTFKNWRTYQMSDHLPMWIEMDVEDTDSYLSKAR